MLNIGSRRRSQARTVAREFLSAAGPGPRLYAVRRWRRSCARLDPTEQHRRFSCARSPADGRFWPPIKAIAARIRHTPHLRHGAARLTRRFSWKIPFECRSALARDLQPAREGGGRWRRVPARKSQMAVISNPRSGTKPIRATLVGLVILAAA